jgi:uncharacterized protein (TIGR03437 family)
MRPLVFAAVLGFACGSTAAASSLPLPPAIRNGIRIGATQPNAQGYAGFNIEGLGFDAAGNMYLAGTDYGGPFNAANQTSLGPLGDNDLFVMKLSPGGERIVYVTRVGGSGADQLGGMSVDRGGNVYLAGSTWSSDFPTTAGSYLPKITLPGSFVLKLDASGQRFVYSTHLAPRSQVNTLAIDESGSAYVGGSATGAFPTTPGAYQPGREPSSSEGFGFITKLSDDGRNLLFSTALGGSEGGDYVQSLAIGPGGIIHATGRAASSDFPTTPGANRNVSIPGSPAVFLARLDGTGSRLLYSTLLYENQNAVAVAVDPAGNSYIAGGPLDFKVTRIDPTGELVYARTFGGAQPDSLNALLVGDDGTLLLGGWTTSPDFPTRDSVQPCTYNLPRDASAVLPPAGNAVFMMLDPAGNVVQHSSLLGGVGGNAITAMAHDAAGAVYLAGYTNAFGFPGTRDLLPPPPYIDIWGFVFEFDSSAIVRGRPAPSCVVNGATYNVGPVAPGAVATIYGSNLGPEQGIGFALDSDGRVPTTLGGMRVMVGGAPAPMLYAQDRQINFVVPLQVAGSSAEVCVSDAATRSCLSSPVVPLSAGVFGAGTAVLNEDGTANTPSNPAARGSVISFFGTGMGPYDRVVQDGGIATPPLGRLQYPVAASFADPIPPFCMFGICAKPRGPFPGDVLYAGQAPGLVNGVTQVNVRIPDDAIPSAYVRVALVVSGPGMNAIAAAPVAVK